MSVAVVMERGRSYLYARYARSYLKRRKLFLTHLMSKARRLHSSILKCDFIITAVILQHVFECTDRLSVYLQVGI